MTIKQTLMALVVGSLLAGMPLHAQETSPETAAWRDMVTRLDPGAFVSIRLRDGHRLKGTLVQVADDHVIFKQRTRIPVPARTLTFDEIDSVEIAKQGMSPGAKVAIGTAIGVGGTVLLALIAALSAY